MKSEGGTSWGKKLVGGLKKHSKRVTQSKSQDGSDVQGASATSQATCTETSPQIVTTAPKTEQPTSISANLISTSEAVVPPVEPSHCSTSNNTAATATKENNSNSTKGEAAGNVTLWDRAYDALRTEDHDLVLEYESLLSLVLTGVKTETSSTPDGPDSAVTATSEIPQRDATARREKLKRIMELGLQHMKDKKVSTTILGHEIVLQDVLANVARATKWAEDFVKDAVEGLPHASIIVAGICLILPLLKIPVAAEAANQDGFTYVTSQMRYYAAMESLLPDQPGLNDDFEERLVDLYKLIINFQVASIIRFYRSRTKNYFRGTINYDGWEKKVEDIKKADEDLMVKFRTTASGSQLKELKSLVEKAETSRKVIGDLVDISRNSLRFMQKMDQRMVDAEDRACVASLQATNPRHDKIRIEETKGGLLRDSYCWVLNHVNFQNWLNGEQVPLFWIRGDPGKGKTMLLCGIIDELIKSTAHTANICFFFCQTTYAHNNSATAVLRGLISMLVKQQPSLMSYLREGYGSENGRFEGVNAWVAVSDILNKILRDPQLQKTYILIDALDECCVDLRLLLDLIQKTAGIPSVKWVVSSRNWPNIEKGLGDAKGKIGLSLELNEESVSASVNTYIVSKVEELGRRNRYDDETKHAVQKYLSLNANGTFLWVALVCNRLHDISGWEAEEKAATFPPGLDALYERMMDHIRHSEDAKLCKDILSITSITYEPISLDELPCLVDMPPRSIGNLEAMKEIIGRCGSFVSLREGTISLIHQSAQDFLLKKATREVFPSGVADAHFHIFAKSLQVMSIALRRDIYGLIWLGIPIDEVAVPDPDPLAPLRYYCVYWVDHLEDCMTSEKVKRELQSGGSVERFLDEIYLYWLEALSLLRRMSWGTTSMIKLEGFFKTHTSQLVSVVRDRRRFIQYHQATIQNNPLQVYASALVFSPGKCLTRTRFELEEPQWIVIKPVMRDNWSACLQTLEGHMARVTSVAWSPDNTQVASASTDGTVRIWDLLRGKSQSLRHEDSSMVNSVAWSTDGIVASGSADGNVRIWKLPSKECRSFFHNSPVSSVAWSSNGKLASGFLDGTVRIWDLATGECQSLFNNGSHLCLAWSPHDSLASGSVDGRIIISDPSIGQYQILDEPRSQVYSIAWSNDNKLASLHGEWITVWNLATGESCSTLPRLDTGPLHGTIAWSSDSTLILESSDHVIKTWNSTTYECKSTLEGHGRRVSCIAVSPDGTRLVSGSDDCTVKIWDLVGCHSPSITSNHTRSMNSVVWSPDGMWLASASGDDTIIIWDHTGLRRSTLRGHTRGVVALAWSHDGMRLASTSIDYTIKIWDPHLHQCHSTVLDPYGSVVTLVLAWSHNKEWLATASMNQTLKIWDMATYQCLKLLACSGLGFCSGSISWSFDDHKLAAVSSESTVSIWSRETGECDLTLKVHDAGSESVAWVSDSKIAVVTSYGVVEIWDLNKNDCQHTVKVSDWGWEFGLHCADANYLYTTIGKFDWASLTNGMPTPVGYGIDKSKTWITYEGQKVLRVPQEYVPNVSDICGRSIAMGCETGRVLIWKFSEDTTPLLRP